MTQERWTEVDRYFTELLVPSDLALDAALAASVAAGLAPQHRDLVPEDQDLDVFDGITLRQQYEPAEHPDHEQVDETDKHER